MKIDDETYKILTWHLIKNFRKELQAIWEETSHSDFAPCEITSKNKYNYQLAGKRDKIDLTKEKKIFANFQLLKIKSHIKLALLLINIVVLLSLNNDI